MQISQRMPWILQTQRIKEILNTTHFTTMQPTLWLRSTAVWHTLEKKKIEYIERNDANLEFRETRTKTFEIY